jgi:DNA-binding NarL/FixJ family response regulator
MAISDESSEIKREFDGRRIGARGRSAAVLLGDLLTRELMHFVLAEHFETIIDVNYDMQSPDTTIWSTGLPHIIVIHLDPVRQSIDTLRRLDQTVRKIPTLIVSRSCGDHVVHEVQKSKALGFIHVDTASLDDFKMAVGSILDGKAYYSPVFRASALNLLQNPAACYKILSNTENRVLSLVGSGYTDTEIAMRLEMAPATAKCHRHRILSKLGISSTPKLMMYALSNGFTVIDESPTARNVTGAPKR